MHGLSCDNVEAFKMVCADGTVVDASRKENADLFWALRGGGGNFGVVVEFEVRLHPLKSVIFGSALCRTDDVHLVLRHWRDFMPNAPDALKWGFDFRLAPHDAAVPAELRGQPVASESVTWIGDRQPGHACVDHALAMGNPVAVAKAEIPFGTLQTMADQAFPHGNRYYTKSGYFAQLDERVVDLMLSALLTMPSPMSQIELTYLGGAMARVGAGETAFGDRSAPFIVNILGNWKDCRGRPRQSFMGPQIVRRPAAVHETWGIREFHERRRRGSRSRGLPRTMGPLSRDQNRVRSNELFPVESKHRAAQDLVLKRHASSHVFRGACYYHRGPMKTARTSLVFVLALLCCAPLAGQSSQPDPAPSGHPIVLHAARLLDVESGHITTPGEILIHGQAITEVGAKVSRPSGAEIIDLGDSTLLPGLIDAHVHLFLHPGAEDLQTIQESVPQRTIEATLAARDDLMAGFTAERDMGTEGAGSADTAVRNAINQGQIPGPRLRISGNAVNILGGHEDAIGYNPEQRVLANATYANNAAELVTVIREQIKEGADFIKIYETGQDSLRERSPLHSFPIYRGGDGRCRARGCAHRPSRRGPRHR